MQGLNICVEQFGETRLVQFRFDFTENRGNLGFGAGHHTHPDDGSLKQILTTDFCG